MAKHVSSITSKPTTLRGWVYKARNYAEKGYAFVWTSDGLVDDSGCEVDVYINKSRCRKVTGTADEPVLTNEKDEVHLASYTRNPEMIVMDVVMGSKGPMAVRWGLRPKRDWLADLLNYDWLDKLVGGRASVSQFGGDGWEHEGILTKLEFNLEKRWVRLTIRRESSLFDRPCVVLERSFDYSLEVAGRYGRAETSCDIGLKVFTDDGSEIRLKFSLPR